jgi:hypothetical protein
VPSMDLAWQPRGGRRQRQASDQVRPTVHGQLSHDTAQPPHDGLILHLKTDPVRHYVRRAEDRGMPCCAVGMRSLVSHRTVSTVMLVAAVATISIPFIW